MAAVGTMSPLPPMKDVRSPRTRSPPDQSARNTTSQERKQTFKDKLHSAIIQAEEAELQALREAQMQDKKSLAISMLIDGRPQSFIDFFKLTHGTSAQPTQQDSSTTASTSGELPQEALIMLKLQLVKADSAKREGNIEDVYGAYKQLAKYFAQLGRLKTAEFFFKQCLFIAKDAAWLPGELEANLALGVVYEELKDTQSAISCHERRLELAAEHALQAEVETAFQSLTAVYLGQAEKYEQTGDIAAAIDSYNRCLKAADQGRDAATAATANYRLGMLYHQQSKWQDAIFYLRKFTELSGSMNDKSAEGVAHTTYAQCLHQTGDVNGAILSLERYLETTSRAQDQTGPAIACCSLGNLYYEQNDFLQAVKHFEKFFEHARGLSDRRVLDTARFNLGIARGAVRMAEYMDLANTDLPKLIQWKNNRVPFFSQ